MEQEIIHNDFTQFSNNDCPHRPPLAIKHRLFRKIKREPSQARTFASLLWVQAITGLFTLLVCPQLGVGFGSDGLMHRVLSYVDLHFGALVCTFLCSIVFIAPGVVVATTALPRPLVANIRIWHCAGVAVLLLLPLATIAQASMMTIAVWLLGSLVASVPCVYVKNFLCSANLGQR
ncbi:MAG: hypothetical protein OYH77_04700 [Pseudomonadota bacterium]|nr:hypothetical protein [Pseudomonadota bacterium]